MLGLADALADALRLFARAGLLGIQAVAFVQQPLQRCATSPLPALRNGGSAAAASACSVAAWAARAVRSRTRLLASASAFSAS